VSDFLSELTFLFDRIDLLTVVDLLLVTIIFAFVLSLVRGTQAVLIIRGMILFIIVVQILSSLESLPAFSWLVRIALPALLVAIPVIFAPEIRRALERLGRAGSVLTISTEMDQIERIVRIVVASSQHLSNNQYGALIVLERDTPLDEYVETGVELDAILSPGLMQQIFYLNTPLHDGAVIVRDDRILAAACVMPLSASGTTSRALDRQMGLRHRAALGISEVSDAVSVVVSEETGDISVTHNGRMIRRLDRSRLRNILIAFFRPRATRTLPGWASQTIGRLNEFFRNFRRSN
jgi:diadenylate cyclase